MMVKSTAEIDKKLTKFTMKVLPSGYGDCVLARKDGQTFDSQNDMSRQGNSPDYECGRQLWECRRHVTTGFHL